jgi:hypothetical protein
LLELLQITNSNELAESMTQENGKLNIDGKNMSTNKKRKTSRFLFFFDRINRVYKKNR